MSADERMIAKQTTNVSDPCAFPFVVSFPFVGLPFMPEKIIHKELS